MISRSFRTAVCSSRAGTLFCDFLVGQENPAFLMDRGLMAGVVRGFVLPPYNLVPGDWVLGIFFLSFFLFLFLSLLEFPSFSIPFCGKCLYEMGLTWVIYEDEWLGYVMMGGGTVWLSPSGGFLRKPKKTKQTNVWEETRGWRTGTGG